MYAIKTGHHKHSKLIITLITIFGVILGLLELSTFYTQILNNEINIILTIILLVLCVDNFIHFTNHKDHRPIYIFLSVIFLILTISHAIRQVMGPVICNLPTIFSIYLYEGFAIIFGIFMISSAILIIKENKKLNYHSSSLSLVGMIITINHMVKLFIGICV
jgi:hypothetical protein